MKRFQSVVRLSAIAVAASVCAPASAAGVNLIQGGNFDTASDVSSFWSPGSASAIAWSSDDADSSAASGSMGVRFSPPPTPGPAGGLPTASATATQCVANAPAGSYNFSASVFGGSNSGGSMALQAFPAGSNCTGNPLSSASSNITGTNDYFTWTPVTGVISLDTSSDVLATLNFFNQMLTRPVIQGLSLVTEFDNVVIQNSATPVVLQSFDVE